MNRRLMLAGFGIMATVAALATSSWACNLGWNDRFVTVAPEQAPVGATVTVTGGSWQAGRDVEVSWRPMNEASASSLGTVMPDIEGGFSLRFGVPANTAPGFYTVVARQGDDNPKAAPLEITSSSAATTNGSSSTPSGSSKTSLSGGSRSAPGTQSASQPPTQSPEGSNASLPSDTGRSTPAPAGAEASPRTLAAPGSSGRAARSAPATGGAALAADRSLAQNGAAATTPLPAPLASSEDSSSAVVMPKAGTALVDLWTGFTTGASNGLGQAEAAQAPLHSNTAATAALVMVGSALAMGGGFALAERRRRRTSKSLAQN